MKSHGFHEADLHFLRLKLNGAGEVVVKPSFSISDLSFLIIAAQDDQSVTITDCDGAC